MAASVHRGQAAQLREQELYSQRRGKTGSQTIDASEIDSFGKCGNGVARSGANLSERMKFRRPRRSKETVPHVGPDAHDAREAGFQVAKFNGAQQR